MTQDPKHPFAQRHADTRRELKNWPYTTHQIEDTLEPDLIEARGKQVLFEALQARNVTAFVGSGLSVAYGRLSWHTWLTRQLGTIAAHATHFVALASAAEARLAALQTVLDFGPPRGDGRDRTAILCWWGDPTQELDAKQRARVSQHRRNLVRWVQNRRQALAYARGEVEDLRAVFNRGQASGSADGKFPGGEGYPILFEIAEQLHAMLRTHANLFLDRAGPLEGIEPDWNPKTERCWPGLLATAAETTAPQDAIAWFAEASDIAMVRYLTLEGAAPDDILLSNDLRAFNATSPPFLRALRDFHQSARKANIQTEFHDVAKGMLVDEVTHAEDIIAQALTYEDSVGRNETWKSKADEQVESYRAGRLKARVEALRRDAHGIREAPELYEILSVFRVKTVCALLRSVARTAGAEVSSQLDLVIEHCQRVEDVDPGAFLTPTLRFAVGAALRLLEDPLSLFADSAHGQPSLRDDLQTDEDAPLGFVGSVNAQDFRGRSVLIDRQLDPVSKLSVGLKIRRFLTTNYDFEIERYFQDNGFRRIPLDAQVTPHQREDKPHDLGDGEYRSDGFGRLLRDQTFTRDTAHRLTAFSVTEDAADAQIFHLHGRADREDQIVVTERDYMDQYLQQDDYTDTVSEAIATAFSASTILFVGLGMTEDDVLRPLRQFMSNRDRTLGYNAVVLMGADKNRTVRTKFSTGVYMRYGAHTLHYGFGRDETRRGANGRPVTHDWMFLLLTLVKGLQELNDGDGAEPRERRTAFLRTVFDKAMGTDSGAGHGRPQDPLGVLFDDDGPSGGKLRRYGMVFASDGTDLRTSRPRDPDRYIDLPLHLLGQLCTALMEADPPPGDAEGKSAANRLKAFRKDMLDGIATALRTGFFNAALDMLEGGWDKWWQGWQQSPPHRMARFERLRPTTEYGLPPGLPQRLVRHPIRNTVTDLSRANDFRHYLNVPGAPQDWQRPDNLKPTGLRAFDTFIRAVRAASEETRKGAPAGIPSRVGAHVRMTRGRRLYTVAAYRGLGKGSFMTALSTESGLAQYLTAAWPQITDPAAKLPPAPSPSGPETAQPQHGSDEPTGKPVFAIAAFINLSFSTELGSIHDMVLDALFEALLIVQWFQHYLAAQPVPPNPSQPQDHDADFDTCARHISERAAQRPHVLDLAFGGSTLDLNSFLSKADAKYTGAAITEAWQKNLNKLVRDVANLPRIECLRLLMKAFAAASEQVVELTRTLRVPVLQPRVLFSIYSAELLFQPGRSMKNRELTEIFRFLFLHDGSRYLPLDVILVGDENELGLPLIEPQSMLCLDAELGGDAKKRPARLPPMVLIQRPNLSKAGAHVIDDRLVKSALKDNVDGSGDHDSDAANLLHVARVLKPEQLLCDNFPILAMAFYLLDVCRANAPGRAGDQADLERIVQDVAPLNDVRRALEDLATACQGYVDQREKVIERKWNDQTQPPRFSEIAAERKQAFEDTVATAFVQFAIVFATIPEAAGLTPQAERIYATGASFAKHVSATPPTGQEHPQTYVARDFLLNRYRQLDTDGDAPWRAARRTLRNNRLSLTILMAAAERRLMRHFRSFEAVTGAVQGAQGGQPVGMDPKALVRAALDAEKFLDHVVEQVHVLGTDRRERVVLSEVLNSYAPAARVDVAERDHELHMILLRHLAMISTPVSSNVLVRVPEVRLYFDRLNEERALSRRRYVARALFELADRGLVFRLGPHPRLMDLEEAAKQGADTAASDPETDPTHWPADREYRYAVHRSLQSFALEHLCSSTDEPTVQSSFAPTLFASAPSDQPRLRDDAHRFLYNLISSLSHYPDVPLSQRVSAPWLSYDGKYVAQVQSLRAALATLRSTLSLPVITCLGAQASTASPQDIPSEMLSKDPTRLPGTPGLLELYRLQARWMIRKAWELQWHGARLGSGSPQEVQARKAAFEGSGISPLAACDQGALEALYRDEIAWLYNEVGITCLLQGNLNAARGLLKQARQFNDDIEGRTEGGAHHNRICLNIAIVQLERGRIASAVRLLEQVQADESARGYRGRVFAVAEGYLGVAATLLGRKDEARTRYLAAIAAARKLSDGRALCLFLHHLGRLEVADRNIPLAEDLLKEGARVAATCGHEDIRHRIMLTQSGAFLFQGDGLQRDDLRRSIAQTGIVERYARGLGAQSLKADADILLAKLQLEQGAAGMAGQLLSRTMALCRRNGMVLRLNVCLTQYARVLHLRHGSEAALPVLRASLRMAQRSRYALEIGRIRGFLDAWERESADPRG